MQKKFLSIALILLVTFGYATTAAAAPAAQTAQSTQTARPPIARNIVSTQLPASLLKNIRTSYNGYWITECYEKGKERRPDYFITLENADQIVQLKASHKSMWEVVNTQVKA